MVDKVQKIREEVARIQLYTQSEVLKQVLDYIDKVQEEPVISNVNTKSIGVPTGAVELANIPDKRSPTNEEIGDYDHKVVMESLYPRLKEEPTIHDIVDEHFYEMLGEEPVSEDLKEAADNALSNVLNTHEIVNVRSCLEMFRFGAEWQKQKDSIPVNEDLELEEAADEYAPDFSNSIASKAAVNAIRDAFKAGARWHEQQMMANAINGEVLENCDGKVLEYDDSMLDEKLSDCKVFDKVKVIIIKKD